MKSKTTNLVFVLLLILFNTSLAMAARTLKNFKALDYIEGTSNSIQVYVNKNDQVVDFSQQLFPVLRLRAKLAKLFEKREYPTSVHFDIYKYDDEGKKYYISKNNVTVYNSKQANNLSLEVDLGYLESSTTTLYLDFSNKDQTFFNTYSFRVDAQNLNEQIGPQSTITSSDCTGTELSDCHMQYILDKLRFEAIPKSSISTEVSKNLDGTYLVTIPLAKRRINVKRGTNVSKKKIKDSGDNNDDDVIDGDFVFGDNLILQTGRLGIGEDSPEAMLHINGSGTVPPLILEPQPLVEVPKDGAIEFDGEDLYITSNGTRSVIGSGESKVVSGPSGPIGPTGPAGPAGAAGSLGNGGSFDGSLVFTANGTLENAFLNGFSLVNGPLDFTGNGSIEGDVTLNGQLTLSDGTHQNGFVLVSDANGLASWQNLATLTAAGEWVDQGAYLHPRDSGGAETVIIGANTTASAVIILDTNGAVTVNEQASGTAGFRVEGGAQTHLLSTDSANNRVAIGDATPVAELDVGGGTATNIDGTDDILVADDLEVDDDIFAAGTITGLNLNGSTANLTLVNSNNLRILDASSNILISMGLNGDTVFNENSLPDADLRVEGDGQGNLLFVDASQDNVGIASTNPSSFRLQVRGDVGPDADLTYNLGSSSLRWNAIFANTVNAGALTTSFTNGSLVYADATGNLTENNPELFWDRHNDRLGLGTNSPTSTLHVFDTVPTAINIQQNTKSIFSFIASNGLTLMNDSDLNFFINNGGNMGIASASPDALLDVGNGVANSIDGVNDLLVADDLEVDDDAFITGTLTAATLSATTGNITTVNATTVNTTTLDLSGFGAGSVVFTNASGVATQDNANLNWDNTNNRLGIGTNSPSTDLEVAGTITTTDFIMPTGAANGLVLTTDANGDAYWADVTVITNGDASSSGINGAIQFAAANGSFQADSVSFFWDDPNNRLGIGTNAPNYTLDVKGDTMINANAYFAEYLYHNGDTDTSMRFLGDNIEIRAGNELLIDITEAGQDVVMLGDGGDVDVNLNNDLFVQGSSSNIGIGTTNPSSFRLQVTGHTGPTSDSSYNLGSTALRWANAYSDLFNGATANITTINTTTINASAGITASVVNANTMNATSLTAGNTTINGQLNYIDGNQSAGRVLTSDANGVANWQTLSSVGNASTLDGLDSLQFLRSDTSDSFTGTELDLSASTTLDINGQLQIADTDISFDGASTTFTQTTGAFSLSPAAGSNLNVNLSGAGDLVVNTNDFYVDTSTSNVGIGTATPDAALQVNGSFMYVDGNQSAGRILTSDGNGLGTWQALTSVSNASTLDGLDSLQFLRSDTSDSFAGTELSLSAATTLDINGQLQIADTDISFDGASTTFTQTTGAFNINPAAGANLNVALSGAGDFAINTNDLFVDTSTGLVGLGTDTPARAAHISDVMRLEPRSSAPGSAALGDIYVDSDTNEICFYNGTIWIGLSAAAACT